MIRKYAQNLLSRVKRSEKSVQELWLPKSPTFPSVWMNRYQFAGPLRQSHPVKSLSAVRVPSNIAFHSNRSHSSRISTASHLHLPACASLWLRPVRAILYTWLTSLRGMDDLYNATLECTRGKFFPVWRKIYSLTMQCNFVVGYFVTHAAGYKRCEFTVSEYSILTQD